MDANDTIDKRCQLMATMSPLVRAKVETEQWRINFLDSDPVADSIQQALFVNLVSDLTDIGIDSVSTMDDLYENVSNIDLLLGALVWVLPNTFYPRMRRDAGLKAGIENLLMGSMDGDILHLYLDFIGGFDNTMGYIPNIADMCQYAKSVLVSNDVFKMYLESMLTAANDEVDVTTYAVNDPIGYHNAVTNCAILLAKSKDALLEGLDDDAQKEQLDRRIYFASRELLSQDRLNDYGWLLSTTPGDLNEGERPIYDRKKLLLTVGMKISPAYYSARNITPSFIDALGMVCFHVAFDRMDFDDAAALVNKAYPNILRPRTE